MITDREHVIKASAGKFINRLRGLRRDVDANLAHCLKRFGPNRARLRSSTRHFKAVARIVAEKTFGHLASRRVASAQN